MNRGKMQYFQVFSSSISKFSITLVIFNRWNLTKEARKEHSVFLGVIQGWLLNLFLFSLRVKISHAIDNSLDFYCRLAVKPKKVCVSSLGKISGILKISKVSLWNNIQQSKCLTEPIFALIRVSLYSQTHRFACDVYL